MKWLYSNLLKQKSMKLVGLSCYINNKFRKKILVCQGFFLITFFNYIKTTGALYTGAKE